MRPMLIAALALLASPATAFDLTGCGHVYAAYPAAPTGSITVTGPEIVESGPLLLAGMEEAIADPTAGTQIDVLWTRFEQRNQWILNPASNTRTAVCFNGGANQSFDYFAGQVLVGPAKDLPDTFSTLELPASRYAKFVLTGSADDINGAQALVYRALLGEAGLEAADRPDLLMFPSGFSPARRDVEIELWVPLGD